MDQSVINKYSISFSNNVISFSGFPATIDKIPYTNNDVLSMFLYDWGTAQDITAYLLPDIESVLNGSVVFEHNQCETIGIKMDMNNTVFYSFYNDNSSELNPDYSIPTEDFNQIIQGWIEFLSQEPLNGSNV